MSFWQGLANATVTGRGEYFPAGGAFVVRVVSAQVITTRKGGVALVVEMDVLKSNHSEAPAGARRSWFRGFEFRDSALGEVLSFLGALNGYDCSNREQKAAFVGWLASMGQSPESLMELATGPSNALAGATCRLDTWAKDTKSGAEYTVHDWSPGSEATEIPPPPAPPAAPAYPPPAPPAAPAYPPPAPRAPAYPPQPPAPPAPPAAPRFPWQK